MPLHWQAFGVFIAKYQLPIPTPEVAASLSGKRNREIMPILFGRELPDAEIDAYSEEKEAIYRTLIADLQPVAGLYELLDTLAARGIKLAVATSAPRSNVAPMFAQLRLDGRFATVVLGEEVARSKPAPDIFLEAARRLGVDPTRCVVFEDAYAGIAAAKAAGMRCIALATTHTPEELRANSAPDAIVADFVALRGYP
jgi:HAD superfamily hydrolase (TIGR01509 family)